MTARVSTRRAAGIVRSALSSRVQEILWHSSTTGRAARAELGRLHGSAAGQRCFVIGNGPSLTISDLDRLRGSLTIASNAIFLAYPDTEFRPTYYVVEDRLVAEDRAEEIRLIRGSTQIFPLDLRGILGERDERIYLPFRREHRFPPRFQTDLSRPCFWGGTVTYLGLQLAFHLGCSEAVLIGVDHSYVVPPTDGDPVITSTTADVNHFHPDYFGDGYRWHDPRLDRMEASYRAARSAFEGAGRRVVNATRGGALEVFDRAELDEVLAQ